MKCKNCGAEGDGKFCEHCGTPLTEGKYQTPTQPEVKAGPVLPEETAQPQASIQPEVKAESPEPQQAAEVEAPIQPEVKAVSSIPPEKPEKGKKQKKSFYKKWWFWALVVLFIIIVVSIATNGGNKQVKGNSSSPASSAASTTSGKAKNTSSASAQTKKYKDGTYLVGKDITAGLYKVTLTDNITKMGYIERAKAVTMSADDILANIILTGNGYVEIKSTDAAVKLQGVEISKIDIASLPKNPKSTVSDGMYLVGYDLKPGTYKVEVTDTVTKMGYVERSSAAAMDTSDIIANEVIQGPSYVEIKDTDFAVRVQGAKLTLQQ